MFEFDPLQLNRLERDVWASFSEKAGATGAAFMYDIMVQWVAKLLHDGKTPSEVREKVVGSFYDNVTLMHRDRAVRNETITLAKVMVEQAIDALTREALVRADALPMVRPDTTAHGLL